MGSVNRRYRALRRRLRRRGLRYRAIFLVVELGAAAAFLVLALDSRSAVIRSEFVQRHGIKSAGIVESVVNRVACDANPYNHAPCFRNAVLTVRLTGARAGVRAVDIIYPGVSRLHTGERITVLDDPRDPTYAELPGAPTRTPWDWIKLLIGAAIFVALAAVEAFMLARLFVRRAGGVSVVRRAGPVRALRLVSDSTPNEPPRRRTRGRAKASQGHVAASEFRQPPPRPTASAAPGGLSLTAEVMLLSVDPQHGGLLHRSRSRMLKALAVAQELERGGRPSGRRARRDAWRELRRGGLVKRTYPALTIRLVDREQSAIRFRRLQHAIGSELLSQRHEDLFVLLAYSGASHAASPA